MVCGCSIDLPDTPGGMLGGQVGETIHGDGTGEQELTSFYIFRAIGGQHEQLHGAFHVDAMGFLRGNFGLGGERSRQMENDVEIVIVKLLDFN